MAEEAKIKIALEGVEEAKAKAASLRAESSASGGEDENPFANEDAVDSLAGKIANKAMAAQKKAENSRAALIARHKAAAAQASEMGKLQLQAGISQVKSGSPMGMLMGGMNLGKAGMGPGGIMGAAKGIMGDMGAQFSAAGMLGKGNMILQGARMAGQGASFLSDRGLTGGSMGGYNPIELVATIKREFEIFWAKKMGGYGTVKDAAASAFILGEAFTDANRKGYGKRGEAEAEYDKTEDAIFGRNERKLAFDAEVAGWIEVAKKALGLTNEEIAEFGAWWKKLTGPVSALLGGK